MTRFMAGISKQRKKRIDYRSLRGILSHFDQPHGLRGQMFVQQQISVKKEETCAGFSLFLFFYYTEKTLSFIEEKASVVS